MYSHVPHDDVLVNDRPHVQQGSHDIISTLYDVQTTTKSPNDAFLRTYPRR